MAVTAKVYCQNALSFGDTQTQLSFAPDYQDERNKEWAAATPALSLTMTVRNDVADLFPVGGKFTLTFDLDE